MKALGVLLLCTSMAGHDGWPSEIGGAIAHPERARAQETQKLAGVELPKTVDVSARRLHLNGMGVRTRFIIGLKIYVAGLYLETPSHAAATVISSEQVKRVHLTFLRSVDRSQVTDAIRKGFERNSKSQMGALKARLAKLESFLSGFGKGDELLITYLPGTGTEVTVKGVVKGVIEGKDFASALFGVWFGADPVDGDLEKSMLGR